MDIGNVGNKLIDTAERHAVAIAFLGTAAARAAEANAADPIGQLVTYLNPLQDPRTGGPIYELLHDVGLAGGSAIANLKWKLWDAPHVPTMTFKLAAGIWAAGQIVEGIIPKKYVDLAGKVAKGSLIAALVVPGSGPAGNSQTPAMTGQGGSYTTNPLSGSSLNSGNPTAGSFYASSSTTRLRGN